MESGNKNTPPLAPTLLKYLTALLICLQSVTEVWGVAGVNRSFQIDKKNNVFLKDGKPFRYISGSIHYSRVPDYYWKDRLQKMYAGGLDAIQVYIPWNVHEPEPGVYDFSGQQDLVRFFTMAQQQGLLVILRAGPYICGEWEFGGFPAWLLRDKDNIKLRTSDPDYMGPVEKWFTVLLPKLKPLLYANGGPIIMVQIENEYGSYDICDRAYLERLRSVFQRYLGNDTVLFTTDGAGDHYVQCTVPGVYATVDFGPGTNATAAFEVQRKVEPNGPLVNSEFYTGWLDYWGGKHAHYNSYTVAEYMEDIIKIGITANVNMYMFEGGTSFGYMNGADPPYRVCPTSYDYDAPLSEAGDVGEKYNVIRQTIAKYKKLPTVPVPPSTPKYAYGFIDMEAVCNITSWAHKLSTRRTQSTYPLSMEQVHQNYGFILYRSMVTMTTHQGNLSVPGVRDRAWVYVNDAPCCILDRNEATSCSISMATGDRLDILVENQGRINFGSQIRDNRKGLISNVTVDGKMVMNWDIYSLNFTRVFDMGQDLLKQATTLHSTKKAPLPKPGPLKYWSKADKFEPASIYMGQWTVPSQLKQPQDTFLRMDSGWHKGVAFLNGFNLGRYWPVKGPQVTLYVPASVINPNPTPNILLMVELEGAPCSGAFKHCNVELTEKAFLNSTGDFPPTRRFKL